MLFIVGAVVVVGSVLGSYAAMGGHIEVLWQPFEFLIILGAAFGSYIIGNPKPVLARTGGAVGQVVRGSPYTKDSYLELLSMQYQIFKLAKSKGALALEQHVENPEESALFTAFPRFMGNHHAMTFFCDYLRLVTMGSDNPHEIEALIDEEIETHHEEMLQVSTAIQNIADGTPALGIVAAVLGVIKTMGSIDQPPEILGHLIGGALVGTFLGVFVAYGFFAPMATSLRHTFEAESKYFLSMKAGLLAHMAGYAPAVSIEFARKAVMSDVRPTFAEVEESTGNLQLAK